MRPILLFLLFLVPTNTVWSQEASSYIYVEGIKSLSFHIKMNGKNMAMLNRNYYLIPVEKSGETILEVSFPKDEYPRQTFMLNVNMNSCFAYKLAKKETNNFYLLDLINHGKVVEANSMVNVGLSTPDNRINFQNTLVRENRTKKQEVPRKKDFAVVRPKENVIVKKKIAEPVKPITVQKNNATTVKGNSMATTVPKSTNQDSLPKPTRKNTPAKRIYVSNCHFSATDKEVKTIIDHMSYKSRDDDKFILLKKKIFSGCLSTQQTALLLSAFQGQPTRLAVLHFLRPGIEDPSDLGSLQYLFKSSSYRDKVLTLMYE